MRTGVHAVGTPFGSAAGWDLRAYGRQPAWAAKQVEPRTRGYAQLLRGLVGRQAERFEELLAQLRSDRWSWYRVRPVSRTPYALSVSKSRTEPPLPVHPDRQLSGPVAVKPLQMIGRRAAQVPFVPANAPLRCRRGGAMSSTTTPQGGRHFMTVPEQISCVFDAVSRRQRASRQVQACTISDESA